MLAVLDYIVRDGLKFRVRLHYHYMLLLGLGIGTTTHVGIRVPLYTVRVRGRDHYTHHTHVHTVPRPPPHIQRLASFPSMPGTGSTDTPVCGFVYVSVICRPQFPFTFGGVSTEDIPGGLAAIKALPTEGWIQVSLD